MRNQQRLGGFRPKLISIAVASCFVAEAVLANPTGYTVVHGSATFKEVGNVLRVTNSPNAIINWHSFSIGANEVTKFIQQSQSSSVLNRVVGSGGAIDASAILGTLKSNGRVFLLNPSGVVFGAGSIIDVGGLVASSLNLSNADFLANRLRFTDGNGAGSVVNQGTITTPTGGEVLLVGSAVTNGGVITSPSGDVVLAAGNKVELVSPGTPNLRVEIAATDNQAVNLGRIVADSGRIGIYAGLINNSGTIRADSAAAEGGRILLKAKQGVTLESSSILDASGAGGGTIEVLAKDGGTVNVAGRLDASAPKQGDGGFIETSASDVNVASGTVVTTNAPKGKTGLWLVDPNNYRIASYGGDITGDQLSTNLNGTNVTLTSDMGVVSGTGGDVTVDDSVTWSSNTTLTLLARNNVNVNQPVTNTGAGAVKLYAGWNGNVDVPGVVCCGYINLYAPINLNQAMGEAWLIAGGAIYQIETAPITANTLLADGRNYGVFLTEADNRVNTLAGRTQQGSFNFRNNRSLVIGSVGGQSGISADGGEGQVFVQVVGAGNNLTVNQPVYALASYWQGMVSLSSESGNILVNNDLTAESAYGGAIGLMAGGNIALNGANVRVQGGGFGGGSAMIGFIAGGAITATNSEIKAIANNMLPAIVGMRAGTNITLTGGLAEAESLPGEGGPGPSLVALRAGNNVTIGGDVTSEGSYAYPGWLAELPFSMPQDLTDGLPSDVTGIAIRAGNRIIGGDGILDATSDQAIRLMAVNGIGAAGATPAPVRIREDTPDLYFLNTGTTAGDIAVSFATGDLVIDGDIVGTKNSNPNGTYFIEAKNGNLTLSVPFLPGEESSQPLLAGQSVTLAAKGNVHIAQGTFDPGVVALDTYGSIDTSGSGKIRIEAGGLIQTVAGTQLNASAIDLDAGSTITSNGSLTGGPVSAIAGGNITLSQSQSITLGLVESTASNGTVTVSTGGTILDGNTSGFNIAARNAVLNAGQGVDGLETQVNTLDGFVSNGPFNLVNSGDLNLLGLRVDSGSAEVQSTALMQVVGPVQLTGGNLRLLANNGVVVGKPIQAVPAAPSQNGVTVSGNLEIDSGGGDLAISETTVHADNITLTGKNIFIGFETSTAPTTVDAQNLLKGTSAGNFNVLGGASASTNAVAQGLDVELTVGGVVNVAAGNAGAYAQIRAGSPTSIKIDFPNHSSGGFFVNGNEGVVYDGSTDSGFFASGEPATLGTNLLVTYGQTPPVVETPPGVDEGVNQVVAALNNTTDITDTSNLPGGDETTPLPAEAPQEKDKKAGLPVCK